MLGTTEIGSGRAPLGDPRTHKALLLVDLGDPVSDHYLIGRVRQDR
ncbi:hypothetical protein V7968_31090 [Nocardia vulneris]